MEMNDSLDGCSYYDSNLSESLGKCRYKSKNLEPMKEAEVLVIYPTNTSSISPPKFLDAYKEESDSLQKRKEIREI